MGRLRHRMWRVMIVAAGVAALSPGAAWAGETDAAAIVPEPRLSLPAPKTVFSDPAFGTLLVRVGDPKSLGWNQLRPEYSQLQAWNASMSMLLLNTTVIVDAQDYKILHKVDWGWPASGNALRWSPVEPLALYYLGGGVSGCPGAALMRYRLIVSSTPVQGQRELVRCFPEYTSFDKNASFEEMSDDGRFIGLLGVRTDRTREAFVYDVYAGTKHSVLNVGTTGMEWISPSPSGKYVIINWGGGGDARKKGVEAFDIEMRYLGKVATGHGHSDLARDRDGSEWYVDYSPDNYTGVTGPFIKKNRIPDGYDAHRRGDTAAIVPLVEIDWSHSIHISCRAIKSGWCVVGTYGGFGNGRQPFEREIFKVYLDSVKDAPHVDRLAQHRSKTAASEADGCSVISYWAQPHATVSPNGARVLFGSNWGRICESGEPVDAFIIAVPTVTAPPDRKPPLPPKGIRVR